MGGAIRVIRDSQEDEVVAIPDGRLWIREEGVPDDFDVMEGDRLERLNDLDRLAEGVCHSGLVAERLVQLSEPRHDSPRLIFGRRHFVFHEAFCDFPGGVIGSPPREVL